MSIEITHEAATGTLVQGDTRPHKDLIKRQGFRWGRSINCWYLPQSRDRLPKMWKIDGLAKVLREAGVEVSVDVQAAHRSTAEAEADRAERIQDRQEALTAKAERKGDEADALWAAHEQSAALIPLGQPILVGHHSERRHRNHLDRLNRQADRALETYRDSTAAANAAAASVGSEKHRENPGTVQRRIERFETELRDIARKLDGTSVQVSRPASGTWREQLLARQAETQDKVAYWRTVLASLVEDGAKVWGPDDFTKGDRVLCPFEATVERVNKKTLGLRVDVMPQFVRNVPYDKIRSKIA